MSDTPIFDRLMHGPRDPLAMGRQVAVVNRAELTTPILPEAQEAVQQWMLDHAESFSQMIAPFGLHINDLHPMPTLRRVVYTDELPI